MTSKFMTSAAALTAALAFGFLPATAAFAGPDIDDSEVEDSNVQDNSTDLDLDLDVDIDDSFNDNSTDVDLDDSLNDNSTDLDVDVDDSFNDNSTNDSNNDNSTNLDVDVDDSFNDNSTDDSNNDNRDYDDSFNDEREYDDSFNTDIDDSYNSDSSIDDSYNDNSDNSTTNIRVALSLQNLQASVSGFEFEVGEDDEGELRTGDISNSGGAYAGFAGIQTVNYNTGFAANNQAATAISANANVTFGSGG